MNFYPKICWFTRFVVKCRESNLRTFCHHQIHQCAKIGRRGGGERWSHFWQCQDFESGCYPNPALIRPLCGGVIWYEWTDHELTLTILFWPGTPCCFTSQFLSRSRPLREFHEAFYTDYVLISCLTFYSEQKRYIFKVTNKLTIVIWLWNKLELWSSPTTGTRPLTPGQK